MPRLVPVAALLLALSAHAAPAPAPPPKKAPKEALARGRALVKKSDFAGAVKVFQDALTVAPEDATVLSELGLAAQRAGDLKLAEQASRKAVALAVTPQLRAASLYNLGRVQEARGEKAAAVDSYRRSLEDRPNKIVRERLLGLDPAAAAALDPFAPQPLVGPFPSLAAFCKATEQRAECTQRADPDSVIQMKFTCDPKPVGKQLALARAPFQAVTVFNSICTEGDEGNATFTMTNLGLQIGGSWWVVPALEESLETMRQTETAEVDAIETKDVFPGGATEVVVRTSTSFDYRGMSDSSRTNLRVIGLGASGKPSATPAILVEISEDESDEEGNEISSSGGALEVVFLPDGIEVKGPTRKTGKGISRETLAPLLGKHPLAFP